MSLGGHSGVLATIIDALDALSIRYFVGSSFASIVFGELRTTQDVDIVVELEERQVAAMIERLSPEFFVDEDFLATPFNGVAPVP
jgi:predicted nucleotidyltransferase